MLSAPVVSVVIPAFNRADVIGRSVDSVLAQTYQDFEIIVVDDGGSDNLARALGGVGDDRLRTVAHGQNRGAAAARNTGVAEARGRYIAFLDSDDWWLAEKLERQLKFMENIKHSTRASCTAYRIFTPYCPAGELRVSKPILNKFDLSFGCRVSPGSTLMAARELFDEVGPLCESLRRLEDWDWLLRLTDRLPLATMSDVLTEIDYRHSRTISYRDVRSAARLMRSQHFIPEHILPSRARLRFLGTLENELSATAFKNKRYSLALKHFLFSILYYPYRSWRTVRRIVKAVGFDLAGRD